jgi:thiol-disulfide isomerase/thioredoxin
MRRLLVLVALLTVALAGCGLGPPSSTDSAKDTGTPQQQAIAHCPSAQPGGGGLPKTTLGCLGIGPAVDLSTLKGPLLINIWGGWCEQCMKEMPMLGSFYAKYGDRLPMLGIDSGDTVTSVALNVAVTKGERFPQLVDQNMTLRQTPLTYSGLPATFLLTASGKVVALKRASFDSEAELLDDLAKQGVHL